MPVFSSDMHFKLWCSLHQHNLNCETSKCFFFFPKRLKISECSPIDVEYPHVVPNQQQARGYRNTPVQIEE